MTVNNSRPEAPFATCPRDGEPLISSMDVIYKEWLCMVCGDNLDFFEPIAAGPTPELSARYEELKAKYDAGERP